MTTKAKDRTAKAKLDAAVRECMVALICGAAIFITGCAVYSAGGSELWAWGGVIALTALAVGAAILLALLLREAGTLLETAEALGRQRHATVQPGTILLTVTVPADSPALADRDMLSSGKQLLDADLAIDLDPEQGRAKVVKYRYGPTDAVDIDLAFTRRFK